MPTSPHKTKSETSVISIRVNPEERGLLEVASSHARTNLSDFMRRKALEAAELDVMEQRIITIPADSWEKFELWANRPAEDIPALRKLMNKSVPWQK